LPRNRGSIIFKCCATLAILILVHAAGHHHGIRGSNKVDTSTSDGAAESNAKTVVDAATVELKVEKSVHAAENGKGVIVDVENSPSNEAAAAEDTAVEPVKENAAVEPAPQSLFQSSAKIESICGRNLPNDLLDHNSWATPYTPSYFENEPTDSTDAVLVVGNSGYGNTLMIGLFHAIDMAYDQKCEIYISKDCTWIWDVRRLGFMVRDTPEMMHFTKLWKGFLEYMS
jgi:hypothetical protein